ncbi:hypothetical protein [Pseudalkalibacillus sp. SCS-8]|uniref:hypothetical protein n=1 Tax=Pseudalkalibacillus nanhaiensis TaxID=3115291 RepID=UPI0032DBC7FE
MRKEIKTITINTQEEENEGVIILSTFNEQEVGVCISKRYGGDVEIWINKDEAVELKKAIEIAIRTIG